jgi:hypothetical protein
MTMIRTLGAACAVAALICSSSAFATSSGGGNGKLVAVVVVGSSATAYKDVRDPYPGQPNEKSKAHGLGIGFVYKEGSVGPGSLGFGYSAEASTANSHDECSVCGNDTEVGFTGGGGGGGGGFGGGGRTSTSAEASGGGGIKW